MNSDPRPEAAFTTDRAALEAEANGNAALPQTAAPDPTGATPAAPQKTTQQVEREMLSQPRKTSADTSREAIYAKAAANRDNIDESETAMRSGAEMMMPPLAERMAAEAAGRPVVPRTAPAPAPAAEAPPLDRLPDTVTLKVEGREIVVSRAQVEQAGIATMQKETSADYRLNRIALAEQAIVSRSAELDRRAAEIEALRTATPTGASAPAERQDLPTGGTRSTGGTKQVLSALLDSDVDTAAEQLDRIVAERAAAAVREQMARAPAPAPAASAPTSGDDESLKIWPTDVRLKVAQKLERTFSRLRTDQNLRTQMHSRLGAEMASPVNRAGRVDLEDLAFSIAGELIETSQPAALPSPAPAGSVQDELAVRRTLAMRVPGVPTSSVPRSVNPAPTGPAPMTPHQIVQGMRKARGQQT